jgi:hypothetical protein|tara:strand:+ start:1136 stop:1309 length:174 start_codon:yes stop_codon:yes gene_type:complete
MSARDAVITCLTRATPRTLASTLAKVYDDLDARLTALEEREAAIASPKTKVRESAAI